MQVTQADRERGRQMDKQYYSAESLDSAIQEFEREYCVASEDVYAAYIAEEAIDGIPHFTQHAWASFYEDVLRLTDGVGIEREPVMTRVGRALVDA
jgi:DNA-binding PucR family transcriptional regulator